MARRLKRTERPPPPKRAGRLTKAFYARDALSVAFELIGCLFVFDNPLGRVSVRLVEVEAYRGVIDPGSHGYRGETPRTRVMYGPPAHLYVYFTYGMHWCANIVCARDGECEAVLLRAGEPVEGIEHMRSRRPAIGDDRLLTAGPARLTQALGIGPEHNGESLLRGGRFWCARDEVTDAYQRGPISQTVRIGLTPGRGDDLPWRFVVPGHPYASRRR
ncbi:MAG: DNA-3-methyladenine glycosylase [Actinomycetota bacterium]|nr:DNA-3-methyladenine glycosylase [Actinomycetota bacterium]